jgi:aminoglycoside phosphotransferase (APT) family kinase protein
LVKSADPGASLQREAQALELFAQARNFSVPRCLHRTNDFGVLGIEWISRAPTLFQLHQRGRFPLPLARRLGDAMAEIHSVTPGGAPSPLASVDFGARLRAPSPDLYATLNPSGVELLARVQRGRGSMRALEWLSERVHHPEVLRLVHGDLRQPNVLVPARGRPVLIDWEQAGWADPASDVGALWGDYLLEHLVPAGAQLGRRTLREFSAAMLKAYAAARPDRDASFSTAVVCWAAVALLLFKGELGRGGVHLINSALEMLEAPPRALQHFTGQRP